MHVSISARQVGYLSLADFVAGALRGIDEHVHEGAPLPAAHVKHLHVGLEVGLHGLGHAVAS